MDREIIISAVPDTFEPVNEEEVFQRQLEQLKKDAMNVGRHSYYNLDDISKLMMIPRRYLREAFANNEILGKEIAGKIFVTADSFYDFMTPVKCATISKEKLYKTAKKNRVALEQASRMMFKSLKKYDDGYEKR